MKFVNRRSNGGQDSIVPQRGPRSETYDSKLLDRLKHRDNLAQEAVWSIEHHRLAAIADTIIGSPSDSEALISDLFVDFFFHYVDHLESYRSIPTYLKIMAIRRARRHIDRRQRQVELDDANLTTDPTNWLDTQIDNVPRSIWLQECLSSLTERSRRILTLHFGHEWSYTSIGQQLGITKQAIGKTVQKSLETLRSCMESKSIKEEASS